MKKLFYLLLIVLGIVSFSACDDDTSDPITPAVSDTTNTNTNTNTTTVVTTDTTTIVNFYKVSIKIVSDFELPENLTITLSNSDTSITETADNEVKEFTLQEGSYNVLASGKTSKDGKFYKLSGALTVEVSKDYDTTKTLELKLETTESNQIIITEVYCGNSTYYDEAQSKDVTLQKDKYIKLYNNSSEKATIKNFCIGISHPYMSNNSTNTPFTTYDSEGWTPANLGFYWLEEITFEPYEEKIFVVYSDDDYSSVGGVNLDNDNYYCFSNMSTQFNAAAYYTAPKAGKTVLNVEIYGQGTAWQIGYSPALFIFTTGEVNPKDFAENAENQINLQNTAWGTLGSSLKIKNENILDGVDIANAACTYNAKTGALTSDASTKYSQRLCTEIDKGYVFITATGKGFSFYRNVDKEATEALEENQGKIVTGYSKGTETETNGEGTANGSTDPSGIDAEASIKNGAHIIYQDTNNSTNDFHQRKQASLKD